MDCKVDAFKHKVKHSFDKGALTYDLHAQVQKKMLNELIFFFCEQLKKGSKKDYSMLDLGCGTGESTKRILKKICLKRAHLIDISSKMIELSKTKLGTQNKIFDVNDFDFFDNFEDYNLIISNMAMHWSFDIYKLFRKILDSVNKNSLILISFPNSSSFNYLKEQHANLMNYFPNTEELIKLVDKRFFFRQKEIIHSKTFKNAIEFFKSIKMIGANVSNVDIQMRKELLSLRKDKKRISINFNISCFFLKKIRD